MYYHEGTNPPCIVLNGVAYILLYHTPATYEDAESFYCPINEGKFYKATHSTSATTIENSTINML